MLLQAHEQRQVLASSRALPLTAVPQRVEDFIAGILGWNAIQQGLYFPSPDPDGSLAIAIADLTHARERILRDECIVPTFVIYEDRGVSQIAGLSSYLELRSHDVRFRERLVQHNAIRDALRRLERGHHLEALAAAILNEGCDRGEATQSSGDQGIDAIGWKELITIEAAFSDGSVSIPQVFPGQSVLALASSKAVIGQGSGKPKLLDVAHVRELVGGWVIQRSPAGKWKEFGIQTLTPVQMILVTTYRMSVNAKSECRILGIQVWGIPELIYLICKFAPDDVFDAAHGYAFSVPRFRAWWTERDRNRLIAA